MSAAEPERGSIVHMATCRYCEGPISRYVRTWVHTLTGMVPCGLKWAACSTCFEIIVKTDIWRHRLTGEIHCGKGRRKT